MYKRGIEIAYVSTNVGCLCSVLVTIVLSVCPFYLTIALSVFRTATFDYPFRLFKLFCSMLEEVGCVKSLNAPVGGIVRVKQRHLVHVVCAPVVSVMCLSLMKHKLAFVLLWYNEEAKNTL